MGLCAHSTICTLIIRKREEKASTSLGGCGKRVRKSTACGECAGFYMFLEHIMDHTISLKTSEVWRAGGCGKRVRKSTACGECAGFYMFLEHIMDHTISLKISEVCLAGGRFQHLQFGRC